MASPFPVALDGRGVVAFPFVAVAYYCLEERNYWVLHLRVVVAFHHSLDSCSLCCLLPDLLSLGYGCWVGDVALVVVTLSSCDGFVSCRAWGELTCDMRGFPLIPAYDYLFIFYF